MLWVFYLFFVGCTVKLIEQLFIFWWQNKKLALGWKKNLVLHVSSCRLAEQKEWMTDGPRLLYRRYFQVGKIIKQKKSCHRLIDIIQKPNETFCKRPKPRRLKRQITVIVPYRNCYLDKFKFILRLL